MENKIELFKSFSIFVMSICSVVVAFGIMKMVYEPPDTSIDVMRVGDDFSRA